MGILVFLFSCRAVLFARSSAVDLCTYHDGNCRFLPSRAKLRQAGRPAGRHLAYHKCISVSDANWANGTTAPGRVFFCQFSPLTNHLRGGDPNDPFESGCLSAHSSQKLDRERERGRATRPTFEGSLLGTASTALPTRFVLAGSRSRPSLRLSSAGVPPCRLGGPILSSREK